MSNTTETRVWSQATNQALFEIGDKVILFLADVFKDSPLKHGQTLTIEEVISTGMPKIIKYKVKETDKLIPESRLKTND